MSLRVDNYLLNVNAKKLLYATLGVVIAILVPHTARATFGVSPGDAYFMNMLPNTEITREIAISADESIPSDISVEFGGEFTSMLSGEDHVIIDEEGRGFYEIRINTNNLEAGSTYHAFLKFMWSPQDTETYDQAIALEIIHNITVTVTDEIIINPEISGLGVSSKDEKNVEAMFTVKNKGNIPWKPAKISLVAHKLNSKKKIKHVENFRFTEEVQPFDFKNYALQMGDILSNGLYKVDLKLYDENGEVVATREGNHLQITQGKGKVFGLKQSTAILLAILSGFLAIFILKKSGKKSKKSVHRKRVAKKRSKK